MRNSIYSMLMTTFALGLYACDDPIELAQLEQEEEQAGRLEVNGADSNSAYHSQVVGQLADDLPPDEEVVQEVEIDQKSAYSDEFVIGSKDATAYAWTDFTSEENPPRTCSTNEVARGFGCSGSFCDNVRLDCVNFAPATFSTRSWTSYFSEEGINYRYCPWQSWVTGIACQGSYCDNIALECTRTNFSGSSCVWSGYFSEEDPPFVVPSNHFIRGVQCNGSFCDNKRFYYCKK